MPVLGQVPTEVHLNATTPAAPSEVTPANNYVNIQWQAGAPYTDPNNSNFQVRDVSAYAPVAGRISLLTSGSPTLVFTLDPAATWPNTLWRIKKIDSATGKVTILPGSSGSPLVADTIEGRNEYDLVNQYDFVILFSDGTNIYIFGSNTA